MTPNQILASKAISYVLRHNPSQFGIELDSEGWVDIDVLCKALETHNPCAYVTREGIEAIIAASEKKRFEIKGNRIRATYGHSIEQKIEYTPQKPPTVLYHGTTHQAYREIAGLSGKGLKPMGRQYVHLSSDIKTAITVGKRRDPNPIVFSINARLMYDDGIEFYHTGNDTTWLCDSIPKYYIKNVHEASDFLGKNGDDNAQ